MSVAGEATEFIDTLLGVVASSQGLQVIADQLVETLAEGVGSFASLGDELLIDGESEVH